ncbi:MAG: hypothetical protein CMB65_00320 [Euryarchaeota archaeon]|nr:hypothetical protein [Euryarchaeota archaeon]
MPVALSIEQGGQNMGEEQAFDSRLAALRERGFEVTAPTGDLASQEMLYIEEQATLASSIKSMVLDLPTHREEEKQSFLTRLINPLQAASVEIELRQLLRQHRPWVLISERVQGKWSDEGRSVELERILERLDAIEDSIVMGSPRILSMIEDVSPMRKIEPVLGEIERRNAERLQALQGMIQMLDERGWNVSSLYQGTIYDRFDAASQIQSLDEILSRCQRKIENMIRPFGHNIAEKMWGAVGAAQKAGTEHALVSIEQEIDKIIEDLAQRLETVEARISNWQSDGFLIDSQLPLLASEMIVWEAKLPTISEQIEAIYAIWARMELHLVQWPEYRRLAERTRGHLNAIESLEVLLQGLIAKTDGARGACNNRLEVWSGYGINIDTWAPLVDSEPRAVLEELEVHQSFIDLVIPLIEKLEALDTSIDGESRVLELLADLRGSDATMIHVEVAKDWLELASNRRIRHRTFLDRARLDLATLWPASLDPSSLDLEEYELAITELESHGTISSETETNRRELDDRLDRVIEGLKGEIDDWRYLGWSVDGLLEMLAKDPIKLGLDLPEIRASMSVHQERVARFSPAPWALDIQLAERVLSELRRPECLAGLDAEFQDLMRTLACAEGVGDPEFEFTPFIPSNPVSTVEKRLPVLIPVIEEFDEPEIEVEKPVEKPEIEIHDEGDEVGNIPQDELIVEDEIVQVDDVGVEDVLLPTNNLLKMFGITSSDDSWSDLIAPPIDVRVQRLVRLAFVLDKGQQDDLLGRLPKIAKRLEEWTAERLSRRNASSGNGLLIDAKELGLRLEDIPGPGAAMPLSKDDYPLPDSNDYEGLKIAVDRLERAVKLPSAMIQMPEPVES